ncbi:hypothetical protein Pint_07218 [Pistacia integerrima]|uniref:Uncharacterized protein n=1 Tax=Pistacia integerrima TaxID=434235 RepID=A0ACC0XUY6_9ROSI|nr:hypothetical protein Pint_07218 [Pistacia integerrima]
MEEYLQYMKTLRCQMNGSHLFISLSLSLIHASKSASNCNLFFFELNETEVEDQTAKVTVEEQMLITTINSMENDLVSAKSDTKLLREEAEKMNKEKGQICAQILAKQRKIASLESDSSTLNQTMELIQQERVSSSKKLAEKRAYYTQVAEDIKLKLKQQQDWFEFGRTREMTQHKLVKGKSDEQMAETEGKYGIDNNNFMDNKSSEAREILMANLVSAKDKLDEIAQKTLKLLQENKKVTY